MSLVKQGLLWRGGFWRCGGYVARTYGSSCLRKRASYLPAVHESALSLMRPAPEGPPVAEGWEATLSRAPLCGAFSKLPRLFSRRLLLHLALMAWLWPKAHSLQQGNAMPSGLLYDRFLSTGTGS